MKRFSLAAVLASASLLPSACSPPADSHATRVQERSSTGHYILPAHGSMTLSPPMTSNGAPLVGTRTPLDSMRDFFEGTSLSNQESEAVLDSQNIQWGVQKPASFQFVSDSFMYGRPWDSNDDPDPQGSYTRSDLVSPAIVSSILENLRPAVEFYPVKGDFSTLTSQAVASQLPVRPVYMAPGDMVAKATNTFPSGVVADVQTFNEFLVTNVRRLAEARLGSSNLDMLLRDAQESEGIGRYKSAGSDRFRTYNFLTDGAQYGLVVRDERVPLDKGVESIRQVYVIRFNGQKLLYPDGSNANPASMEKTLSERGVDSAAVYIGHDVDVRYLK